MYRAGDLKNDLEGRFSTPCQRCSEGCAGLLLRFDRFFLLAVGG
jgi:hypothetical protein